MTRPEPILKSEKLTAHLEKRDKLKANAAQCRADVWRLTKLLSPQIHDVTVSTVIDAERPKVAYLGIKNTPKNGVVITGYEEDAARKEDILKRTLDGETLPETTSVKEQLEKLHRQWSAYEDAIEFCTREIEREKAVLAAEYCKRLKSKHDEFMKRLFKALGEVHAAHSDLDSLRRHLIDNDVGLRGICLTLPEFLDTPNNKFSVVGDFFREGQRQGWIKEIPVEYRA
jgi:hypothetical protein